MSAAAREPVRPLPAPGAQFSAVLRGEGALDFAHDAATHGVVVVAEDAVADQEPGHVDRAGAGEPPRCQPRDGAPTETGQTLANIVFYNGRVKRFHTAGGH